MDVNQANMKSSSNYSAGGSTSISRSELRRMAEKIFSNPNLFRNLLRTYPELVNNIYMRESMMMQNGSLAGTPPTSTTVHHHLQHHHHISMNVINPTVPSGSAAAASASSMMSIPYGGGDASSSAASFLPQPSVESSPSKCMRFVELDPDPTNSALAVSIFAFFYLNIFVLGLVGNLSIVCLTFKHRHLHIVQNIFILNLALSDVIVCLLSLPFTPVTNIYKNWLFGQPICHLLPLVQACSVFVSTFSLSAIAIDRYNLVIRPHAHPLTVNGATIIAVILWVLSVLVSIPYAYYMTLEEYPGYCGQFCSEHWPNQVVRRGYALIVLSLQFLIPFLTMSFCYATIFSRLRERANTKLRKLNERSQLLSSCNGNVESIDSLMPKSAPSGGEALTEMTVSPTEPIIKSATANHTVSKSCSLPAKVSLARSDAVETVIATPASTTASSRKVLSKTLSQSANSHDGAQRAVLNQQRRTTTILASMVLIFGLTWLPQNVVTLIIEYDETILQTETTNYTYLISMIAHSVAMTTNVANPILYAWLNPTFKRLFLEAFKRKKSDDLKSIDSPTNAGAASRSSRMRVSGMRWADRQEAV